MAFQHKTKRNHRENMTICISGMAGSGKSTVAKKLAKKYGLKYYSGGDALKALALQEGYKPLERGWWESEEGMRFLEKRTRNSKHDKEIDEKLLEFAKKGKVILDSWTMPWILQEGLKVWLEASLDKRAERIAKRDGISVKESVKALTTKVEKTKKIYKKLYGFSLGKDYAPFHLILDTDNLTAKEVFQTLCMVIDNILIK